MHRKYCIFVYYRAKQLNKVVDSFIKGESGAHAFHAVNQLGLLFAGILVVFGQPSLSTNINYSDLNGRIFL